MCLFGLARWNQLCITKYLCYTINKACVLGARKCLRLFISSTQRNRARCSISNYLARPIKFTMCHSSISADWLAFVYRFIDFSLNVVVSIKKNFVSIHFDTHLNLFLAFFSFDAISFRFNCIWSSFTVTVILCPIKLHQLFRFSFCFIYIGWCCCWFTWLIDPSIMLRYCHLARLLSLRIQWTHTNTNA